MNKMDQKDENKNTKNQDNNNDNKEKKRDAEILKNILEGINNRDKSREEEEHHDFKKKKKKKREKEEKKRYRVKSDKKDNNNKNSKYSERNEGEIEEVIEREDNKKGIVHINREVKTKAGVKRNHSMINGIVSFFEPNELKVMLFFILSFFSVFILIIKEISFGLVLTVFIFNYLFADMVDVSMSSNHHRFNKFLSWLFLFLYLFIIWIIIVI